MKKIVRLRSLTTVSDLQKICSWSRKKIYLYLDSFGALDIESSPLAVDSSARPGRQQLVPYQVAKNILLEEKCALQIEYEEGDIYVQPSKFDHFPHRPAIVTLAGHRNNGKLFCGFKGESTPSRDIGHSLQVSSIKITTDGMPFEPNNSERMTRFTLMNTPEHEAYWEIRLHAIRAADVVWLPLSLQHGIENHTREVIEITKELKKKIAVLFTDLTVLSRQNRDTVLNRTILQLCDMGIILQPTTSSIDIGTSTSSIAQKKVPAYFLPSYKTSDCLAAAKQLLHYDLKMACCETISKIGCPESSLPQGTILECFRDIRSSQLACLILVRNGTFTRGMWFLADSNYGQITRIVGMEGQDVHTVSSGFHAVIYGLKMNGAPGASTHIIMMPSKDKAKSAAAFRAQLSWFIQRFPKLTNLLRPKGMKTHFHHVGNFGQIANDTSIEYKLLLQRVRRPLIPDGCDRALARNLHGSETELTTPRSNSGGSLIMKDLSQGHGKKFSYILCADSWHSTRLLLHELERCNTKKVSVFPVGLFLGPFREAVVKTAAEKAADIVLTFRVPHENAKADFQAQHQKIRLKHFDTLQSLVEYMSDSVKHLLNESHMEDEVMRKHSFAASFIPTF